MARVHALVVGAGALGNEVVKNLSLLGVGQLAVLDRDRVEASNLTRSVLFCTNDIEDQIARGTPKATLIASRARELNPDVDVVSHVGEVGDLGAGVVRRADLVFSCVDNEMARLELGWICTRLDKPLVDGGLGLINASSGLVSLFPGAAGPCYACRRGAERRRALLTDLQGREDPCGAKERLARDAAVVPTTPIMASIVGALQVELGVRHLFSRCATAPLVPQTRGLSHRVTIHPQTSLQTMTFERSPNCPLHHERSLIRLVEERVDRCSDEWTAAELLGEGDSPGGFLSFDWPMTARASCRGCDHAWEPMLRRARFRRALCPICQSPDLAETEVLTGIDASSPWAARSLASLGLPLGHIHEVIAGQDEDAPRRHIEISGDFLQVPRP